MKLKQMMYKIKPPCTKCPYKLGTLQAMYDPSPCPLCMLDGYKMFEVFQRQVQVKGDIYHDNT